MRVFPQRCQSSSTKLLRNLRAERSVRKWLSSKERPHYSLHTLHRSKLNELFTLLPTRSFEYPYMNLRAFPPRNGNSISLGFYFGLFPDMYDNAPAKMDGAQAWHAPHAFARRFRHSGRVAMSSKCPPLVGMNFVKKGIYLDSKETRAAQGGMPILYTRRKMAIYQWFPVKTELLNEECVTAFYHDKFNGSVNSFGGLPDVSERFLSYTFMPTRRRVRDFAMFFQDTHKIHYDPDYAKSEGYPDLVVGTSLQLAVILDIMQAYMPKGLVCNAIEYRVFNPLFCDNEIRVFRHWYQKDPPSCLDDLAPDLTFPVDPEEPEGSLQPSKQGSVPHAYTRRSITFRRSSLEAHIILWSENENGVVGTVVLAALVKNSNASWELDPQTGYILPVGSTWPLDGTSISPTAQRPTISRFAEDLDDRIAEPDTFDSLGRPISNHPSRPLRAWPSRHPWQQDDDDYDDDVVALESERKFRRQYAARLEESRNLLGQIVEEDDNSSE